MTLNLNSSQATGIWTRDNGTVVVQPGHCWSGNDNNPKVNPTKIHGKNNPLAESEHCIGPTPKGLWRFGEWAFTPEDVARLGYPAHLGLITCHLTQIGGESYGRDGFYVHGPSSDPALYGQESEGCQVMLHNYRVAIAAMLPDTLTVTA
jgi:hypothetical protein